MLHKKTLERLRKEAGVCYYDLDQVNKALDICHDKYVMFNNEFKASMCFHNVILNDLFKYNVISADKFDLYKDFPSFKFVLDDLDDLLSSYILKQTNDENKEALQKVQKRLKILKGNIKDDEVLIEVSKPFIKMRMKYLEDDIKNAKEETEALIYIKRKLKKKAKNSEKIYR